MKRMYKHAKLVPQKESVKEISLHMANGKQIFLDGARCESLSLRLYDQLRYTDNGYAPVVESGCIKVCTKGCKHNLDGKEVGKEFFSTLVADGGVLAVRLHDALNWSLSYFGNIETSVQGDTVAFTFYPLAGFGAYEGDTHYVRLEDLKKEDVRTINIAFENCEWIRCMWNEVTHFSLTCKDGLSWNGVGYHREVKRGKLGLLISEEENGGRSGTLFEYSAYYSVGDIIDRLLGEGYTDTCYLDVCTRDRDETFMLRCLDWDSPEEDVFCSSDDCLEEWDVEEVDDAYEEEPYISGTTKMQKDGIVVLKFGK